LKTKQENSLVGSKLVIIYREFLRIWTRISRMLFVRIFTNNDQLAPCKGKKLKKEVYMKIIIAGPPKSGKSCLREGLKQAIRRIPGAPYPYIITACPDGEGAWFQETVNRSPEEARRLKEAYKASLGGFTPAQVEKFATWVKECNLPLTLVDIGGIPSPENEQICRYATHAILLAGDSQEQSWDERLVEWREFCRKLRLRIIAEIHSDYHGTEDTLPVLGPDGVWRGSVHYLERGEPVWERPTVKALAEILVRLVAEEEK
jgi:CRISPR-associated protein Csx3